MFDLVADLTVECVASWNKPLAISCTKIKQTKTDSVSSLLAKYPGLQVLPRCIICTLTLEQTWPAELWCSLPTHQPSEAFAIALYPTQCFAYFQWHQMTDLRRPTQQSLFFFHISEWTMWCVLWRVQPNPCPFWSTEGYELWHPATRGPLDTFALNFALSWIKEADILEPFHFHRLSQCKKKKNH